jgi:hypothetical protein
MDRMRSTFPLDESAIARAALRQICTAPVTWAPLVPVVAAYTVFDVPGLIALAFGVVVALAIFAYWRKQWPEITDALRRVQIHDHNLAQNELLKTSARKLLQGGEPDFASRLEDFLKVKILVERRLHEDGALSEQKIQIEQLVDSLCFGVRDELTGMAEHGKSHDPEDRRGTLNRVSTAYETLRATVAELDTILGPSDSPAALAGASLEEITRRLHDEAEIARRVRARLRQPESADLSPAPIPPRIE